MSQTVVLAAGTRFKQGREIVELTGGTASFIFPTANSLDAVAEILANSAGQEGDPSQVNNLVLNAAVLNRQIIASAAREGGYDAGTALDVTYGPRGERIYTTRGIPPVLVLATTTIEDAADTIIVANFDKDVNSALADYKTGFSVKVAGVARTISSAARQVDNKQIKFTLASAVTVGQAVLLSYNIATGDLKSDDGAELQSFTDSVVINNVV